MKNMVRYLYTLSVVCLLGASAVMAGGIEEKPGKLQGGVGFVLMTNLQR